MIARILSLLGVASAAMFGSTQFVPPCAGRALNQNELTFSSDVFLVRVGQASHNKRARQVSTRSGQFQIDAWSQRADVVDGARKNGADIELVFLQHLASRPGMEPALSQDAVELPLPPGDYLVLGTLGQGSSTEILSSVPRYGFVDNRETPGIPKIRLSGSPAELFVFAVFPTKLRELPPYSGAKLVITALTASAADGNNSMEAITRLLASTNHEAFSDWLANAVPARRMLMDLAKSKSGYDRARLLLTAAHLGADVADQALQALVDCDSTASWDTPERSRFLNLIRLAPLSPSPAQTKKLLDAKHQATMLRQYKLVQSPEVKTLILRNMSGTRPDLPKSEFAEIVPTATLPKDVSRLMFSRLALWFDKPEMDPYGGGRDKSDAAVREYWRAYFRARP